jgi:hypothetical protein
MVILNMIIEAKKELILLAGTIFIALLGECLVFNHSTMLDRFFRLKEQRYTIQDGSLYQMELKSGRLLPRGLHPNITFNNIDMQVDRISIACKNSVMHERGQVFFRAANEDFTWVNSVSYETSTNANSQIIDLPGISVVSSLRFDLTHSVKDVVTCSEFVINPPVPFNIRFRRVAIYMLFVMLAAFEIIQKLSSKNENPQEPFPSLSFQRLATPLLAVCLVFPDVVFLGASLRITDQVQGNRYSFPLITFYPHYAHQKWDAGISDYGGAFYQSEPMMEFMVRSLREGESPYWNPYSAAGSLGPETLVDNKFSAFTLAYAFLGGGQKTFNAVFLFLYFLAAYFTYRLIREKLQLSFLASLAGIFFFLLNGYATANVGSNVTQSYLFVPICLYASISFIEKPTAFRISGVGLSFAAFFSYTFTPTALTGFVGIYVVFLGYVLMLYRKAQMNTRWLLRVLAAHAACVFASILLLAFIYFPIVENLHSTDTVNVYSDRTFRALSWIMIPSVFSSSHFFESYQAMEQGVRSYAAQRDHAIIVYHLGTTALTLAICSLSLKRRDFSPFVLICMTVILIAFGRVFGVPGISSLISKIPIISYMIGNQYWWPIIVIPLIFLVALGVDNLQNRLVIPGLPFLLLALLVCSLTAVGAVYGLHEPNLWYKQWSISLLLATAIASSLATALSAYTSLDKLRNYVASALVILAFVELTMDSKTMRYAPDDLFTNRPTEITFIKKNIELYRTLTIGYDFGVRHELGSAFGIQEVTAINIGNLSHYMDYFHNMISLDESQRVFYDYYPSLRSMQDTPEINTIDWAAVDLLGIKFIIAPTNFSQYRQVFVDHGLIPVLDAGTVYVYQNPNVFLRAFTIDMDWVQENEAISLSSDVLSKLEPAAVTLYRNNEVVLKGTVNKPSLLVLTDNWQANWKAFVNDAQTDIILVDGTFRGVRVPAGQYEVRFHYQPRTLNAAILTSGIIIFLIIYISLDHKRIDSFLTTRFAQLSR